ncbi:VOC family protein [Actinomadura opuntiae]|uniref:VOC family protein n=1 Tax=Actinomadura sp. OS1-43 TaxID=604315 RepID=UPI00255B3C19|nr:VOC family protein [Actinomadura sp. OS1-43]MDL4815086.1 VOC family protein [Actinomadura sp. OS1-43]
MNATDIRLGGLVLGSDDPERLSAWYREAFAPDAEPGIVLMVGGGRLVFDRRDDLEPATREPGRILINFYVEDIEAVASHLKSIGVERWIRPVEDFGPGRVATVEDPVGNYVQIVQLAAGH